MGVVRFVTGDVMMARRNAREAIMARSLDNTDGGSEKKERSGQLHNGELSA